MTMEIHDVVQGSPEWLALRSQYNTASEAPAMMGASKYQTRAELVRQKATGYTPPVSGAKQALYDRGHETEASARTILETMIDQELYPVTASNGRLLASYDGLTMDETIGYEHKLRNEELVAQVRAGDLEPHYYWQLEHQILVGGLDHVIFVCSDGTAANFDVMEYYPVPGRAEQLLAGWKQFDEDVASYQHVEVLPAAVATEQPSLPAVIVNMGGALTVSSNLPDFAVALREYIKTIPAQPSTDQEFADCEAACKSLKRAEDALQAAEDNALAGMTDVESMRRVVADLRALARATRLASEKMVEARKITVRAEIMGEFSKQAADHLDGLNTAIGKPYMPTVPVDFAAAMKGKKTITGLRDACSQALATFKIAASAIASGIQTNMRYAQDNAADFTFLFADFKTIVLKAPDDFQALVTSRIATHKAEEARKEQQRLDQEEAARQRIELSRRMLAEEEQRRADEEARDAIAKAAEPPVPQAISEIPKPASPVVELAPRPSSTPTMTNGKVCAILGFNVTADFLVSIGAPAPTKQANANLWHERQIMDILEALGVHMSKVYAEQKAKYQQARARTEA